MDYKVTNSYNTNHIFEKLSKPAQVLFNGKKVNLQSGAETSYPKALRVLSGIFFFVSLPSALFLLGKKWSDKRKQVPSACEQGTQKAASKVLVPSEKVSKTESQSVETPKLKPFTTRDAYLRLMTKNAKTLKQLAILQFSTRSQELKETVEKGYIPFNLDEVKKDLPHLELFAKEDLEALTLKDIQMAIHDIKLEDLPDEVQELPHCYIFTLEDGSQELRVGTEEQIQSLQGTKEWVDYSKQNIARLVEIFKEKQDRNFAISLGELEKDEGITNVTPNEVLNARKKLVTGQESPIAEYGVVGNEIYFFIGNRTFENDVKFHQNDNAFSELKTPLTGKLKSALDLYLSNLPKYSLEEPKEFTLDKLKKICAAANEDKESPTLFTEKELDSLTLLDFEIAFNQGLESSEDRPSYPHCFRGKKETLFIGYRDGILLKAVKEGYFDEKRKNLEKAVDFIAEKKPPFELSYEEFCRECPAAKNINPNNLKGDLAREKEVTIRFQSIGNERFIRRNEFNRQQNIAFEEKNGYALLKLDIITKIQKGEYRFDEEEVFQSQHENLEKEEKAVWDSITLDDIKTPGMDLTQAHLPKTLLFEKEGKKALIICGESKVEESIKEYQKKGFKLVDEASE